MYQGRCSATVAKFMLLMCLLMLHYSDVADASMTHLVGGTTGWTFNTQSWTRRRRFAVGDTLVFKYNPSFHNVVAFNGVRKFGNFRKCITPRSGFTVYKTGNDAIKLVKGINYFICNVPTHCQTGMKIAIFV